MPTMQQSIVALQTTLADPPASPALTALAPFGLPDTVDAAMIQLPFTGTLVGISVTGAPAAGDTVTVVPQIASNKNGGGAGQTATSLQVTITNAAPSVTATVSKDQADAQFAAGQFLGLAYSTTTGGAYTVRDLAITLYISTGRTDI